MTVKTWLITGILITMSAGRVAGSEEAPRETFGDAVTFVNAHGKLVVLAAANGASIAVWPAMQGRVLTSSAAGAGGQSFGWINRDLIASGRVQPHMNAVGGEDRLWLGPEGGQYSIFFAPGAPFDLDHWFTPTPFDTETFELVDQSKTAIHLRKALRLTNYSGIRFEVRIDRAIHLLTDAQIWDGLHLAPVGGVAMVGFESDNTLTNVAAAPMSKATGVLSLWVLGQFQAAPAATIILPLRSGSNAALGIPVKTDYFGPIPSDRIHVGEDAALFKADAQSRGKLGISPQRSKGVIGSYDPLDHILTIVQYDQQPGADYVNAAWSIQKDPYKGDVANCYNDGVPAPGKPQLGHFYELESSSPAVALAPRGTVEHTQRTMHFVGPEAQLERIAGAALGISLKEVLAFNHP